jgi:Na+-driven multidrug efflux pump
MFLHLILNITEKEKAVTLALFLSLLLNILLNYILVPKYGILGSATATLLSNAFTSIVIYLYFVKHYSWHKSFLSIFTRNFLNVQKNSFKFFKIFR